MSTNYHKEACRNILKRFDCGKPDYISIAPGRVNIIGEHIDHQGFSVLPVALNSQTINVAIGSLNTNQAVLKISHVNDNVFPAKIFNKFEDLCISKQHAWSNYVIASLFGILEYLYSNHDIHKVGTLIQSSHQVINGELADLAKKKFPKMGLRLLIDGDVPLAAGCSSSSALVVACTSALAYALNINVTRNLLASICANSERHVGTAGGGMDQAAICLCKSGEARFIHFHPLETESIKMPNKGALVICNSGRQAPKAISAATHYNKRVFELRVACYKLLRIKLPNEQITKEDISELTVKKVLKKLDMTIQAAIQMELGQENLNYLLNQNIGTAAVWERNTGFIPSLRIMHVLSETLRVTQFVDICRNNNLSEKQKLEELGKLMNASDESLELYFDCGCPELSELTILARKFGAYGSRLTGAGWGGCTVSLVDEDDVNIFIEKMKLNYYNRTDRLVEINIPEDLSTAIFAIKPGDGVSIFMNNNNNYESIFFE